MMNFRGILGVLNRKKLRKKSVSVEKGDTLVKLIFCCWFFFNNLEMNESSKLGLSQHSVTFY